VFIGQVKNISAQIIDDSQGITIASASTVEKAGKV
jgi:ribosomal protein L18